MTSILEANGFKIYNIGNDVPTKKFIEETEKVGAGIIGGVIPHGDLDAGAEIHSPQLGEEEIKGQVQISDWRGKCDCLVVPDDSGRRLRNKCCKRCKNS